MKEQDIRPQKLFNQYLEIARREVESYFADHSRFVEVPCPACLSTRSTDGLEKLKFKYRLCADCNTLYLSPRPARPVIDAYYRESDAVKFWGTHFFKETAEARREKMFRPRAQIVAEWARKGNLGADAVVADIGPGYGIFLEEIAKVGVFQQVIGVEPAPSLAQICRDKGFVIIEKPFEDVTAIELSASFTTAFEVLEHLFDPTEFLQSLHRTLNPNGLFLLTTLTVSGFDIQVLWEHSKSVYPPHHINFVSVAGMERLLDRVGLEIIELSTPGQLDVDIVRNVTRENPQIPLPRFLSTLLNSPDDKTREDFQTFLATHRLSSHIRVVGRRKR